MIGVSGCGQWWLVAVGIGFCVCVCVWIFDGEWWLSGV